MARIIEKFEDNVDQDSKYKAHHEDTQEYQSRFFSDIKLVFNGKDFTMFEQEGLANICNTIVVYALRFILQCSYY